MRNSKLCVGVFDSGIGGLTVLKDCQAYFPDLSFCYYGDNARAPYGNRPKEEICAFVREALGEMVNFGVDVILLACNTATTICMPYLRDCVAVPTFGIAPPVRAYTRAGIRTLILATRATCESARMRELCEEGGAIFFSTHVLDVAEKLCNKVAIIKDGVLIKDGKMEEFVKDGDSLEDIFMEVVTNDTAD